MNRINFKGKDGGGFHHLTPYQKKSRVRPIKVEKIKTDELKEERARWHRVNPDILFDDPKPIKKVEKISDEITIINEPKGYSHNRGHRQFHSHQTFKKGFQELSVTDSIGGCGMQQFYGWVTIKNKQIGIDLITHYLKNKEDGVGLVLCQLGQDYFNSEFEQALIECEFKVSEEYSNFQHGSDGRYKQRIYSLQTKYKYD